MDSATQRRNIICSEPLSDSLLHRGGASTPTLWSDIYGALPTCPWGISRFEAQKPTIPASLACDSASSSLVTALTNCTLAAGSSIVVTPSGAGDVEFVMSWADFDTKPWLYGAMSKQFKFNWTTTNISAINIYAEGWDGERVLIYANADKATWVDWPLTGTAVKFVGSWEQDFGRGIITDVGADVDADGISPATMGDTLRSCVFGLLPGRTARRIVWVITPTAVSAVTVGYPEFRHNSEDSRYVPEIAQQGVFLTPDGPGVRWGSVQYWNSGTNAFADPPIASDPAIMPTILDGLCTRRVWFEGKSATDGLDAEIATIYDANEYTLRKHMAVDPTDAGQSVHSFVVQGGLTATADVISQPVFCLVSSLREMPPMQCFPVRKRDTDWQTTDDWGYQVWSNAYQDRYYSSAKQELKLNDGSIYWSDDDTTINVNGWKVYSHSRAVDNNEPNYNFLGPTLIEYAEIRPWHGSFAIIDRTNDATAPLSSDCHLDGRHFRSYLFAGEVVVEKRGVDGTWTTYLTGILADWCCIRIDKMAKSPLLYLVTQEGTSIKQYTSSTSGATFSVSTTLHSTGTPRYPAQDIELDGVRYTYWVNGASAPYVVQYLIRDRAGNTLASVATAISGVDDSPIAVRKATPPGGVATIYLQAIVGGAVVEYSSTDGKVFV